MVVSSPSYAASPRTVAASLIDKTLVPLIDGAPVLGRVVDAHRRAASLQLNGGLITVADRGLGAVPGGVSVPGFDTSHLGVRPGQFVVAGGGRLSFDNGRLVVELRRAHRWCAAIAAHVVPDDIGVRARVFRAAVRDLPARGLRDLLDTGGLDCDPTRPGDPIARASIALARRSYWRLERALLAGAESDYRGGLAGGSHGSTLAAAVAAGVGLIGLGPGLTPSGDDLLVGLTAGLTRLGDPWACPLATAWAVEAPARTSRVAAAFHQHAAAGEYSERLHCLLAAVTSGPLERIPDAVTQAAAWGATSGIDSLVGVVLSFRRRLS